MTGTPDGDLLASRSAPESDERLKEAVLSRVLVGYDGSDCANAAAAFALRLAGKTHCDTTLVHASPTPESAPSADLLPDAAEQVVIYEAEWQRRLENVCDYSGTDAPVSYRLVRGHAAGALIAMAYENHADLIVMGSHGVGRLTGRLRGSVSEQVLTHAPCSVMLFREHEPDAPASDIQTVLVGVDGSPESAHAVRLGQALAGALDAHLVLMHAYDPRVPFVSHPTQPLVDLARGHGRELIEQARAAAVAPFDTRLVEGDPRAALTDACATLGPAVLVVGSRGLGGFKELLVGSTARWLADCAPCPVVIARPPAATR